jgi:hypothetical protein
MDNFLYETDVYSPEEFLRWGGKWRKTKSFNLDDNINVNY